MNAKIINILWMTAAMAWSSSLCAVEISIEKAVELALKNSAETKASEAAYRAQAHAQVSSWLDLGPRLSASYNHLFFDSKITKSFGGQEFTVRDDVSKNGSMTLTQPVSALFALIQKGRLEGKKKALKESTLNLTKAQVAFKTAELYLRAQQSDRMWEISKVSIEASQAQKNDGMALFRAERIHQGDLLKLDLAVSQARLAEAKARASREIARFSLSEMIGISDPEIVFVTALFPPNELVAQALPSLEEGLAQALANRLELKQANQGQEVASIAKMASFYKFFPVVNFIAQWDHNFGNPGFAGAPDTKMLGFNMSWEFWNNGSHIYQAREAAENLIKTVYEADALKHVVRIDLVQAMASLKAAIEGLSLATKATEQADEAYRIEKLQFSAGKSLASQLVLAETAKTLAAGNLVSMFTDLNIQKLKLQQALGRTRPDFKEL